MNKIREAAAYIQEENAAQRAVLMVVTRHYYGQYKVVFNDQVPFTVDIRELEEREEELLMEKEDLISDPEDPHYDNDLEAELGIVSQILAAERILTRLPSQNQTKTYFY